MKTNFQTWIEQDFEILRKTVSLFGGASACIHVVLWVFCDGERSRWKTFEQCVSTWLCTMYTSPYKATPLSSVRRPFICIGGSNFTVYVWYVVKSLNAFALFLQTVSRNLMKTEYVTGVWEALCVEEVNYLYSSSIHGIIIFLFGSTAPSGPEPPHSRGFYITHNDAPQSVGLLWTSD